MLPSVYPNYILGSLYLVHQRKDYDLVQMPWRKIKLDEKINGQLYGLGPDFLKEHPPLDIILQTKV